MLGKSRQRVLPALLLATSTGGCVQVPPLAVNPLDSVLPAEQRVELTKLKIYHVIERVKCDIGKSVQGVIASSPVDPKTNKHTLSWLNDWSAKVHMTLTVDDNSAFSPGLSIVSPIRNAYGITQGPGSLPLTASAAVLPSISSISQSFTMGLGGGLLNQATRKEDLEFYLSVSALTASCTGPSSGILIESDLGLKEWIESAVSPTVLDHGRAPILVHGGVPFTQGESPPQPSDEVGTFIAAAKNAKKVGANRLLAETFQLSVDPKPLIDAAEYLVNVRLNWYQKNASDINASIAGGNVANPKSCTPTLTMPLATMEKEYADSVVSFDMMKTLTTPDPQAYEKLYNDISAAANVADQAYKEATVALKAPACAKIKKASTYDPLDLIQHEIDFYVTVSGNVTPLWKFARISNPNSPGPANYLFGGSRKFTNTLIISMGRPKGAGQPSDAQTNNLLSATIGLMINRQLAQ